MNRHSKLPARFLLVLLGTILLAAGLTSVSLAADTTWGGSYFDVVEASATTAYFAVTADCADTDENCTVKVTGTLDDTLFFLDGTDPNAGDRPIDSQAKRWAAALNACTPAASSGDDRYEDFEQCWVKNPALGTGFTVTWPSIKPDDDFEITPYCKSGDDVCAEELRVCFNANDCDGNSYGRQPWTQMGELWDEAGSCLYDDNEDDVWECLDEALDDWLDDNMDHNDDYDDLEDEEEEDRGFTLEDYESNLSSVGRDWPSPRRAETALERSRQQETSRTPTPVYRPGDSADTRGPGVRLTGNEYLTINFTAYLETDSPYRICNTTIGCINVATLSNTFRPSMQNLHIVIQDTGVLRCMGGAGWDVGNNHAIPFDNANLIACDERIRTANQVCPAKAAGASGDLFAMWDTGLLKGLLPDSYAQGLRLQVERARDRTPKCLCTAGFAANNLVVTSENTVGPWERSSAQRTGNVCG